MQFELEWIRSLAGIVAANQLSELEVKDGDRHIRLRREPPQFAVGPMPGAVHQEIRTAPVGVPSPAAVATDPLLVEIKSPMVGTFYRAPNPDSPNFIEPGDDFAEDAVLCIIEAMKVMNEIKSEFAGRLEKALVENGESVEYGQPLFLVRKKA